MRDRLLPIIFSAVIVLIQIVFAPILTVFSIVPNFIVAFVIVLVLLRRPDTSYGYVFVLGLISDLLAETPLGLTPLLLLVLAFVMGRTFEFLDNSTATMPLITIAVAAFVYELVFMIVLLIVGYGGSFIELLLYRALPSTLFVFIIGAILYFIMRRFPFTQATNDAWRVSDNVRFR